MSRAWRCSKARAPFFTGSSEPGGIINIITKEPLDAPYYAVAAADRLARDLSHHVDATGPLNTDKSLLYRMNMSYENNGAPFGSFIDLTHSQNLFLAPVVKWNIDASTWVKLEAEYNHNRSDIYFPFDPLFNGAFVNVPRNTNYGTDSPYLQSTFSLRSLGRINSTRTGRSSNRSPTTISMFTTQTAFWHYSLTLSVPAIASCSGRSAQHDGQTRLIPLMSISPAISTRSERNILCSLAETSTGRRGFTANILFLRSSYVSLFNPIHLGIPSSPVPVPLSLPSPCTLSYYAEHRRPLSARSDQAAL